VNTNPSLHLGGDAGVRPVRGKAEGVKSTEEYNKSIDTQNVPSQTLPPQGSRRGLLHLLVHTGQHYDDRMSRAFFESLGIPEADINLGIGSGTHAEQVGHTMIALEKVCLEEKPDWVVVVGDVNAT